MLIDRCRARAPLGDGPNDQRLASPHVAADVHPVDVGGVGAVSGDVASGIEVDAEPLCQGSLLRTGESHGEEHQVRPEHLLAALDGLEGHPTVGEGLLDPVGPESGQVAVLAEEFGGVDGEDPLASLLVCGGDPVEHRPGRPRVGVGPVVGWPGHDFELVDRGRSLPVGGAQAVGAGVATADDHDVPAGCVDRRMVDVAFLEAVPPREVLHGLVDAVEFAAGDREVTPPGGSAGEDDGVVVRAQVSDQQVGANLDVRAELGALGLHLGEPVVQVPLLHLELWDPVAQESTDAVGAFEHHDVVPGPRQLLGGSEAGRAGADHRYPPTGALLGRLRQDPALCPGTVHDADLDLLDGHGRLVDAEDTGGFTGSRTEASGELREVVRGMQALAGLAPVLPVDEVVPVRDQVAERTTVVAERNAAVHTAAGLLPKIVLREGFVDLSPVAETDRNRSTFREDAIVLEEAAWIAHGRLLRPSWRP